MLKEFVKIAEKFIPEEIGERLYVVLSDADRATDVGDASMAFVRDLLRVPGMTPASSRDLRRSSNIHKLQDGSVVSIWTNPAGCKHIFLSNSKGECIFAGFTGWMHNGGLENFIGGVGKY